MSYRRDNNDRGYQSHNYQSRGSGGRMTRDDRHPHRNQPYPPTQYGYGNQPYGGPNYPSQSHGSYDQRYGGNQHNYANRNSYGGYHQPYSQSDNYQRRGGYQPRGGGGGGRGRGGVGYNQRNIKPREFGELITDKTEMMRILKDPNATTEKEEEEKQVDSLELIKLEDTLYEKEKDERWEAVKLQLINRLENPLHKEMDDEASLNTFQYLWNKMKMGIFVRIKDNKLANFNIFVNDRGFRSNWGELIVKQLEESGTTLEQYYEEKRKYYRYERILEDPREWWLNGNMIDNERPANIWGEHLVGEMRDMIDMLCKTRKVPDVEFFLNKRDHPQLKSDFTEPYDFVHPSIKNKKVDLHEIGIKNENASFTPVVSFFIDERFADLPFPCADDWKVATNFSSKPDDNLYDKEKCQQLQWEEKSNTCFFRGSATGGGVTKETNQRIMAAYLSKQWNEDDRYNANNDIDHQPFLDAGITTWNVRDKKRVADEPMKFIKHTDEELAPLKKDFVPMYDQLKYKYFLYVDGHCAAARYSFLLRIGAVILKVKSFETTPGNKLWFFPLLKPGEDHIEIKADLSDLAEKIEWCKKNDEKCRQISEAAKKVYERYVSKERIIDYCQFITHEIAKRRKHNKQQFEGNNKQNRERAQEGDSAGLASDVVQKSDDNKPTQDVVKPLQEDEKTARVKRNRNDDEAENNDTVQESEETKTKKLKTPVVATSEQ